MADDAPLQPNQPQLDAGASGKLRKQVAGEVLCVMEQRRNAAVALDAADAILDHVDRHVGDALKRARWYLVDHQEAQPNEQTVADLRGLDAALAALGTSHAPR